ncbi:uncharacterized protein LOC143372532 [Andrena cerasifolii]|uniref:uncharacterized protein LOC143372532 n=1 Tax=Andrena cerasifolii TaxID=2819439 RepID=UPI0040380DF1
MALSRISSSSDLLTALSRISHAVNASLCEMQCTRYAAVHHNRTKGLHVTSVRRYPDPPVLPLPTNVSEIFANETGRFAPDRARDIAAPVLIHGEIDCRSFFSKEYERPTNCLSIPATCADTHVDSYDCFGAVSLNGTMQSNVPKPFCSSGKSTHLNMPGGQWARDGKYIAEDMQRSHYRNVRLPQLKLDTSGPATNFLLRTVYWPKYIFSMEYSTNAPQHRNTAQSADDKRDVAHLSKKERFKKVVKDYGSTVIVFHVGISLISLGACYTAVISGLDLLPLIKTFINDGNQQLEKILSNSSNFLLAYTIHKLFAPVRISITLAVTPFLVRYLRRIGILKAPVIKQRQSS